MTRIRRKLNTARSLLVLCLAAILLLPLATASAGVGEKGYPLPDLGTDQIRGSGHIDDLDMEEQAIVLDDKQFRLLPTTLYYTSTMGGGSIHLFLPGKSAGYITNPKGEILKLWLLE